MQVKAISGWFSISEALRRQQASYVGHQSRATALFQGGSEIVNFAAVDTRSVPRDEDDAKPHFNFPQPREAAPGTVATLEKAANSSIYTT